MLVNIIAFIKKLFSFLYIKTNMTDKILEDVSNIISTNRNIDKNKPRERETMVKDLKLDIYQDEVYVNTYDINKPTILILDDIPATEVLYSIDFKNIHKQYNFDVVDKFNIIMIYGKYAGFAALKFLKKGVKVDYAILDITVDSMEKFDNGDFLDIDGIDIAIELDKISTDTNIVFCSAHTLNVKNNLMSRYINKYNNYFKNDIEDHAIDKNSVRFQSLYNFLRK